LFVCEQIVPIDPVTPAAKAKKEMSPEDMTKQLKVMVIAVTHTFSQIHILFYIHTVCHAAAFARHIPRESYPWDVGTWLLAVCANGPQ
jgi:hypothetical protein